MEIKESDWKVFRRLRELALERYCRRVLNDVSRLVEKDRGSSHECYLKLWELLRDRDRTIGDAFDDPSRSRALIQLLNILNEDLLTETELIQFSDELRDRIETLRRI